jgi:cytosine deaminase
MALYDTLFANARLPDGSAVSLAVKDGSIAAHLPPGETVEDAVRIDLGHRLVLPGFVEGHIHLDTSFFGDAWKPHLPNTNGFSVRERVAFQKRNLASAAPIRERAENQIALCLSQGTTHMRSHVMVDADIGLSHVEAILEVREAWRDVIDIQLVAFPQSGILVSPGTDRLMDEAIALGCDLVGGLDPATLDRDIEKHLDAVFAVAERRDVGVDIHLHDGGTLGIFEIEQICARTRAAGLGGRVAVSHAYCLGQVDGATLSRTADLLADAGVAIMTIAPHNHPFPPVAPLRAAGVTVFSGSDNIRDSWWPYGDGDMLRRANTIGHRSGFFQDHQLRDAFDVVTFGGAKALGLERYGLAVGDAADFVVLEAEHVPQAVVAVLAAREVFKRGRRVARDGKILKD